MNIVFILYLYTEGLIRRYACITYIHPLHRKFCILCTLHYSLLPPPSCLLLFMPTFILNPPTPPQNNHTYAKTAHTAKKNSTHTLHPTPVFSAILNMRFIVPRNRSRVLSKLSFMVSAREEEERISSPMERVMSLSMRTLADMPSRAESFWSSRAERTASEYWPLGGWHRSQFLHQNVSQGESSLLRPRPL